MSETNHIAMNVSENTIRLTGEILRDIFLRNKAFSGVWFLADNSKLYLIGLDWIGQHNLFEIALKFHIGFCY